MTFRSARGDTSGLVYFVHLENGKNQLVILQLKHLYGDNVFFLKTDDIRFCEKQESKRFLGTYFLIAGLPQRTVAAAGRVCRRRPMPRSSLMTTAHLKEAASGSSSSSVRIRRKFPADTPAPDWSKMSASLIATQPNQDVARPLLEADHPVLEGGLGMKASSLASTLKTSPPTRNWKPSMTRPLGLTVACSSTAMALEPCTRAVAYSSTC
jgi:hypothetical protein